MESFDVKLLRRAIGQKRIHQSILPLYGDHVWAKDLDIVNELGGHTGCVNALSWSESGRLLASGSDDTYLNIWKYNPDDQAKPFTLDTSVSTGHHANIFSVKFMPHSNDRTVVTCAGDSEVRVFDLEYAAGAQAATSAAESTRSRRFNDFFGSCKWLTEANTNARVYRSHADRAKRIVTESSPHLFLSCSEDGEVRQWDLRQPSSAYPPPRDGRAYGFRRAPSTAAGDVPPALISYKSYGLDLNTISCSKSQPHYIALGGAHLHCFLHDRRMLGRNLDAEKGRPPASRPTAGSSTDESMREATKCVRRFAPNNKRKMRPGDHGHITACKISDARPNELIASWSGDHIYSFDIVKGPDARDDDTKQDTLYRANNKTERKRKRGKGTASSASVGDGAQHGRRLRRVSDGQSERSQTALQTNEEEAEAEEDEDNSVSDLAAQQDVLTELQRRSQIIAHGLVKLRAALFDFRALAIDESEKLSEALTRNTESYTNVLGQASALLPELEEVMRTWTYPNTTDEDEIDLQNTLRRNRQSSWRFVQAAGTLSRTLGGVLQTVSSGDDPRHDHFLTIRPAGMEGKRIDNKARFCYDFVKAITLWLNGGKEVVLEGFRRPKGFTAQTDRFPFDQSTEIGDLAEKLRNYLLPLAREDTPVIDLGTNRFERDELRQLFEDQKAAVQAFTRALDQIEELRMYHGTSDIIQESSGGARKRIMDKGAAARFWGEKVCRALLLEAAEGVTFSFVSRAFGDVLIDELMDETNGDEDEVMNMLLSEDDLMTGRERSDRLLHILEAGQATPAVNVEEVVEPLNQSVVEEEDEDGVEEDDDNSDDEHDDGSDSDSDVDTRNLPLNARRRRQRAFGVGPLSTRRASVNSNVTYSSHTKFYKGHCNTRTVKDVNYYGPNDEYIVSGSDDGHFFIWDRKTTEIVSVLEGDGEVVNVVQGHPYEPMIACSGIDSTIKIFGPGGESRERYDARMGINIASPGGGRHSSLGFGRARRQRRSSADSSEGDDEETEDQRRLAAKTPESVAKGGLKSRRVSMDKVYQITSQNNAERQRGVGDAFMTQGMLERLAIALQNGQIQAVGGEGGGQIVIDENCSIM